jgi:hypothetical protein
VEAAAVSLPEAAPLPAPALAALPAPPPEAAEVPVPAPAAAGTPTPEPAGAENAPEPAQAPRPEAGPSPAVTAAVALSMASSLGPAAAPVAMPASAPAAQAVVGTLAAVPPDPNDPADRIHQALWFTIARKPWNSVVLVPADEGISTASIAMGIADVGRRLRNAPVTAMVADQFDYAFAAQLAPRVAAAGAQARARSDGPQNRVIVSIPPVTVDPLGVAVAQAADATILCIAMGRSRLAAVQRTIQLIGRDCIAGCFLIR